MKQRVLTEDQFNKYLADLWNLHTHSFIRVEFTEREYYNSFIGFLQFYYKPLSAYDGLDFASAGYDF